MDFYHMCAACLKPLKVNISAVTDTWDGLGSCKCVSEFVLKILKFDPGQVTGLKQSLWVPTVYSKWWWVNRLSTNIFFLFQINDSPHLMAATDLVRWNCHTAPTILSSFDVRFKGLQSCQRLSSDTSPAINWAESETQTTWRSVSPLHKTTDIFWSGKSKTSFFLGLLEAKQSRAAQGPTQTQRQTPTYTRTHNGGKMNGQVRGIWLQSGEGR